MEEDKPCPVVPLSTRPGLASRARSSRFANLHRVGNGSKAGTSKQILLHRNERRVNVDI